MLIFDGHLYTGLCKKAKDGLLGAARVATEMPRMPTDPWDGGKSKPLKNWMELAVTANNVAGQRTIVMGVYVAFVREGTERVLVAGKDLAHDLDYYSPLEQQAQARALFVRGEEYRGRLGGDG